MKKGITVAMMVVVVLVIIILVTSITVTINSSVKYSSLSVWVNEINTIQEVVYETVLKKSAVDFILDEVEFNTSSINSKILEEQFAGESIKNNIITFNEIDLGKLEIINTVYGNKKEEKDIYLYSQETQKVYYMAGIEEEYYTLNEDLNNRFNVDSTGTTTSVISFVPSKYGFTNTAISVEVKVPIEYTDVVVVSSVSDMKVTNLETIDGIVHYRVNSGNIAGNYNITVTYNDGKENLISTYTVNGYDNTSPEIEEIKEENLVYILTAENIKATIQNIKAIDNESGIDSILYIAGTVPKDTENILEYFQSNGTKIRNNKFKLEHNKDEYTICAIDKAGNYATVLCDVAKRWIQTPNRKVVKGGTVLEIGEYINYVSDVNGYTDEKGWQILGAENGELLIISSSNVVSNYSMGGTDDFISGESKLNALCEKYGKGSYALRARSITVEDVDRVTGYDKNTYKYTAEKFNINYGETITYSWDSSSSLYPKYVISNGLTGYLLTEHSSFIYYNGSEWLNAAGGVGEICTLTQSYYGYDVDTETDLVKGTQAYNMLFGDDNLNYWLASPYVLTYEHCAGWGFRGVFGGLVNGFYLVYSNKGISTNLSGIRAVVHLSPEFSPNT